MLFKIDVLQNFENFAEKQLRWSLFLIKLPAWVTICDFCNNTIFTEFLRWHFPLAGEFSKVRLIGEFSKISATHCQISQSCK